MGKSKALKVKVDGGNVNFLLENKVVQSFDISKMRLIAEYTTAKGAKPDHWYLKFVITEEETYELSMYQENIDDVLEQIGSKLTVDILPKLGSSKDWNSRIHYPAKLIGEPLWIITTIQPVGIRAKIIAMIRGKKLDFVPTAAAQKIFRNISQ